MLDQRDKLNAIHRINESVLSMRDINKLFKNVLSILENTFGLDASAVLLYDEKTGELYIRSAIGYKREMVKNFRTTVGGKGITGHAAELRKPVYIPNIAGDSRYIAGINGALCEIAIPLIAEGGELIGVLDIESRQEYAFTDDDLETLELFASHLATALHNALIFEEERKLYPGSRSGAAQGQERRKEPCRCLI